MDALAPLSIEILTYIFLQQNPFCFRHTFLEFLSSEIKTPKVIETEPC